MAKIVIEIEDAPEVGPNVVKIVSTPTKEEMENLAPNAVTPAHSTAQRVLQHLQRVAAVPAPVDVFGQVKLEGDGPDRVVRV